MQEFAIDERSPMCLSVYQQIRAFEAFHRESPGWFAVSTGVYNAMLLEMEQLCGYRACGLQLSGAAIIVHEMCPRYERTTESLH